MSTNRLRGATIVGICASVAAIVGTMLPWITYSSPGQDQTFNGLVGPFGLLPELGIVIGVAVGWLWAGNEPKKPVAVLAPIGFAIIAYCVWAITKKGDLFGFGAGDGSTVTLEYGIYVELAGGLLALVAAGLVIFALSKDAEPEEDAPLGEDAIVG